MKTFARSLEKEIEEIFHKLNDVRWNPVNYSLSIENFRKFYQGKNFIIKKNLHLPTEEGIEALEDLIKFTEKQKPRNKLKLEFGLNLTLKEFCESVNSSDELNAYYKDFDYETIGSKYGNYGNGRIQSYMSNLISEDLEINVLNLLLCDGDETRQMRDIIMDNKFTKIGVFIKHYPNEETPMLILLLTDDYSTKQQYENKKTEGLNNQFTKLNFDKSNKGATAGKKIEEDEDDPDLDMPEGVIKIERKCKTVKENGVEFLITKTIMYMEDGSINTEIKKDKTNNK